MTMTDAKLPLFLDTNVLIYASIKEYQPDWVTFDLLCKF